MKRRSESKSRSDLRARLQARRDEIEAAALTRVRAIADPEQASDPAYTEGLRNSVSAALDYALEAVGHSGERGLPVPVPLLAQARLAARSGVSLDTVLRRYFAGYTLLSYFVIEEAGKDNPMDSAELQRLLASQSSLFDRLLAEIGEEHARESNKRHRTSEQRQAERIVRLLEGELIDTAEIAYDFEGWHLGIAASGPEAPEAIRTLTEQSDCRLLTVERSEAVWAWLGTRVGPEALEPERLGSSPLPTGVALALGEPGEGLAGWRLTHRQAVAALGVAARREGQSPVRYTDVAFLANAIKDELLTTSLRRLYIAPLDAERDGGATAWETLRAYFAAERNATSAAAALGISRQAVNGRLQLIEERLGRAIGGCSAELELALHLRAFDPPANRKL